MFVVTQARHTTASTNGRPSTGAIPSAASPKGFKSRDREWSGQAPRASLELLGASLELLGTSLELIGASLELRGAALELITWGTATAEVCPLCVVRRGASGGP